jgi:lysophospholipase L1-like esterase
VLARAWGFDSLQPHSDLVAASVAADARLKALRPATPACDRPKSFQFRFGDRLPSQQRWVRLIANVRTAALTTATLTPVATADHQGVLAFGDSITNGGGELQWGVALQSWAQWLARGLGLPFTNYAVDGARAADVVSSQIPAHRRLNAVEQPRYQLGCLYIGVNDVRSPTWDPVGYERDLAASLTYLKSLCDRVLTVTIPLDLGRPRAGAPITEANAAIERQAQQAGSLLLDLKSLRGRELMMADHVHPTAMGQIEIATRALTVLAADGLPARTDPRALAAPADGPKARLRAALTYVWRSLKQELRLRLTAR